MWASQLFCLGVLEQVLCTSLPYSFCWFVGLSFVTCVAVVNDFVGTEVCCMAVGHHLCLIWVWFLFTMVWNKIFYHLCFRICHYKGSKHQAGLKLGGTHQLLLYADDVSLLGSDVNTTNITALINSIKEVGIEVNKEKTKYMLMFRHQIGNQNYNIKIDNEFFKNLHCSKILKQR
jgi:hypothetical protein